MVEALLARLVPGSFFSTAGGGSPIAGAANIGEIAAGLGSIFGGFGARSRARRQRRRALAAALARQRAFERAIAVTPEEAELERQIIEESKLPEEQLTAQEIAAQRAILAPEVERAQRAGVSALQRTGLRRAGIRAEAERLPVERASREIEAFRTRARQIARAERLRRRLEARDVFERQRQRRLAVQGAAPAFIPRQPSGFGELIGGGLQSIFGGLRGISTAQRAREAETRAQAQQQRLLDILERLAS